MLMVPVAAAAAIWARAATSAHHQAGPPCRATVGAASYALDLEQAANATTVAAVGKRLGMPDHAVTVALAAALQESGLHNLAYGDLDSLGLFQERPSQGWGTPTQVMVPRYAATAFYTRLMRVPGWSDMAVTDAAQTIEHSAAPDAYARWEAEARVLAGALTGEGPAGLSCKFRQPSARTTRAALSEAMTLELGQPTLDVPVTVARGWTVAAWLVGHARQYGIASVAFAGRRWTPASSAWSVWKPGAAATAQVQVTGPTR